LLLHFYRFLLQLLRQSLLWRPNQAGRTPAFLTIRFILRADKCSRPIRCLDPRFVIHYIDALTAMAKRDGEKWDKKLLNGAIKAANSLHKSKLCTGQGDAELAYHFMTSLGTLGEEVLSRNKRIAGQLFLAALTRSMMTRYRR